MASRLITTSHVHASGANDVTMRIIIIKIITTITVNFRAELRTKSFSRTRGRFL